MKKKTWHDYVFCLITGGIYLYAINQVIISATFISIEPLMLYLIGLVMLVALTVILYNKYTRIIAAALALLALAIILFTMDDVSHQYPHLYDVWQMVTGRLAYRPHLGRTVVWVLSGLFAFAVVVFMLIHFNFWFLTLGGAAAFAITWAGGFMRSDSAFIFFLIAFCLILVRKTNKHVATVLSAAPLIAVVIWLANSRVPEESEMFVRRTFEDDGAPVTAVADFFRDAFTPVHFAFQQTGFSGAGGRLGGPVTPNARYVMSVYAPGRVYLAGAISNHYTGDRWISTLREGDINTHGLSPSAFETLETMAALLRSATYTHTQDTLFSADLLLRMPEIRLQTRHFSVLGVSDVAYYEFYTVPGLELHFRPGFDFSFRPGFDFDAYIAILRESLERDLYEYERLTQGLEDQPMDFVNLVAMREFIEFMQARIYVLENETPVRHNIWGFSTSYLHTYMPIDTVTVRQSRYRTGTVFTPPRVMTIEFDENSPDYTPQLQITPTGTMQLPRLMTRHTGYEMRFLNVDTTLSFIEYILQGAGAGVYESRRNGGEWVPEIGRALPYDDELFDLVLLSVGALPGGGGRVSAIADGFGGDIHLLPAGPPQTARLPSPPICVEGFAELLELFTEQAFRHNARYIDDLAELTRLVDSFSVEVLARYALEVREHFMYVPEITPRRVHDLTMNIIEGQETDFGRVTAIRDFLMRFPYTMETEPVPRGVCFVDWFLFEEQQGYCTYFASAMAVMSRIAGVPSRYVEGFALPRTSNPAEPITVTNRMAHAWVEVYLEGFGWHIIEATPPYQAMMRPGFVPPEGFDPGDRDFSMIAGIWDDIFDYMDNMYFPGFGGEGGRPGMTGGPATPDEAEERGGIALIIIAAVIAAAVLGLIAYLASRVLRVRYRLRRVTKLSPNEQVQAYFHAIMDIATFHARPITPGETPKAYGVHSGKRFAFRSDSVFLRDIIALYYKAKYSPAEITQDEADLMKEAYEDMVSLLRDVRNKFAVGYFRYMQGVGVV